MKVVKVVIYPDYYSDKTFKKGADIALAVVQIVDQRYADLTLSK